MSVYIVKKQNNTIGYYNKLEVAIDFVYSLYNTKLINNTDNICIEKYKINSFILLEEYIVDLTFIITTQNKINYNYKKSIFINNNPEYNEIYEDDSENSTSQIVQPNKTTLTETTPENKLDHKLEVTETDSSEKYELHKQKLKEYLSQQNKLGQEKIAIVHDLNILKEQQKKEKEDLELYNTDYELYNKFKSLKANSTNFIIPFMFQEKYSVFEYLESKNNLNFDNFKKYYKPSKIKTSYDDLFMMNNNSSSSVSASNEYSEDEIFQNVNSSELYKATNQNVSSSEICDESSDIFSNTTNTIESESSK
jgi:hypothetical protein